MTPDTFSWKFHLGQVSIQLTADNRLEAICNSFLLGWPEEDLQSDSPIISDDTESSVWEPQIAFKIFVEETIPPRPKIAPIFSTIQGEGSEALRLIEVYRRESGYSLYLANGAVVHFPELDSLSKDMITLSAAIAVSHLSSGFFEDLFYTGLAGVLRRHHQYLVHAFAVEFEGQAILFVGPSGSGKTTAGLKLCLEGGGFLANDVAILTNEGGLVYAHPTPGFIGVSRATSTWMKRKYGITTELPSHAEQLKSYQPAVQIVDRWAKEAPVGALIFPVIGPSISSEVREVHPAISLARLIENSIDRWDVESIAAHTDLLTSLSSQAAKHDLILGNVDEDLTVLLSKVMVNQKTIR